MAGKIEKLITLVEAAELLRVSRHTVQAWVSPSSPNHRPEFARMVRHAGRKTLFVADEIAAWLQQRRGTITSPTERSNYWRERFIAGRGLLKGLVKSDAGPAGYLPFQGGIIGLDTEPLIAWLADGPGAASLYNLVMRADGLMVSTVLAAWILRRSLRFPARTMLIRDFMLEQNVFEVAPFNDEALRRSLTLGSGINELALQNYSSCLAAGCNAFLSGEKNLVRIAGLPVISFV